MERGPPVDFVEIRDSGKRGAATPSFLSPEKQPPDTKYTRREQPEEESQSQSSGWEEEEGPSAWGPPPTTPLGRHLWTKWTDVTQEEAELWEIPDRDNGTDRRMKDRFARWKTFVDHQIAVNIDRELADRQRNAFRFIEKLERKSARWNYPTMAAWDEDPRYLLNTREVAEAAVVSPKALQELDALRLISWEWPRRDSDGELPGAVEELTIRTEDPENEIIPDRPEEETEDEGEPTSENADEVILFVSEKDERTAF